jgi:hypothetical protein
MLRARFLMQSAARVLASQSSVGRTLADAAAACDYASPAVAKNSAAEVLIVAGREVTISNPDKVLFPQPKYTKRDLVRYYISVSDGALRGAGGRPNMLVRYPNGIEGEHFY